MDYKVSYPKFPYVVGWSITNKCNLKCLHCNMDSGKEWNNELTFEECCKIIDELALNNVKAILFTGGEPLTREDFFDICDYAIKNKINVSLTTNGTLVTEKILKTQFWKFQSIRISLDSMYEHEHDYLRNVQGTYKKAIACIKEMTKYGYNVSISTCISKRNVTNLEKMADFLDDLGINRWCMPLLSPDGRGKNISNEMLTPMEIKDFLYKLNDIKHNHPSIDIGIDLPYIVLCEDLREIKKTTSSGCPAAISELTIFANGDISPCFAMVTSAGNVRNTKIQTIWKDSLLFKNFRDKSLIEGKCSKCDKLLQCGGGCRANPYLINNNYLGEDIVCWK